MEKKDGISKPRPESPEDTIGAESVERYALSLGYKVEADFSRHLVLCEIVNGDMDRFSRRGFVEGWLSIPINHNMEEHKTYLANRTKQLPTDPSLFKKVYRHSFFAMMNRKISTKALDKGTALAAWALFFSPSLHCWKTPNVNWLEEWSAFLDEKWHRTISKDMWNQTLEFADKTMQDVTLGFWSEDQAWPGVIDDFVLWCRENKIVPSGKPEANSMDVDEDSIS